MIVSHEHRFVFVKTMKTAGTAIEVLLARHAGPDAIVGVLNPPVPGHEPRNLEPFLEAGYEYMAIEHTRLSKIRAAPPGELRPPSDHEIGS